MNVGFTRRNENGKAIEPHINFARAGRSFNPGVGTRGGISPPSPSPDLRWGHSTPHLPAPVAYPTRPTWALILQKTSRGQMMGCPGYFEWAAHECSRSAKKFSLGHAHDPAELDRCDHGSPAPGQDLPLLFCLLRVCPDPRRSLIFSGALP